MQASATLNIFTFRDYRTYLTALAMIAGNIIAPWLCHAFDLGGPTWLPIYFFTLICAYKWGWRAGLLTALASPVLNSLLFGMPAAGMVAAITVKSVLLAVGASWISKRYGRATIARLAAVVVFYQFFGSLAEWAITGNLAIALGDVRTGIPGILAQIIGGRLLLGALANNKN